MSTESIIAFAADQVRVSIQNAAFQYERPSVVFRPALSADGTMWCALFGENLQDGVSGFGETPEKAMVDFDINWLNAKTPTVARKRQS